MTLLCRILASLGIPTLHHYSVWGDPARLHLHPTVHAQNTLFNTASGHIRVGAHTFFGHGCMVLTGTHENGTGIPYYAAIPPLGRDITIGSHCWIASGAIIIGGVTIGDNCTVMAGAVVTKDVPDGCRAGGIPAKVVP